MDLKELLKPDKEKIITSVALIIISIIFISFGIYFAGFNYPKIFFIMTSFFYLPVFLVMETMYSIIPSIRPDMDTMTASQFSFHFGLIFLISCVYVYFISCIVLFVRRKRRAIIATL